MKTIVFEEEQEWLDSRFGKITGTSGAFKDERLAKTDITAELDGLKLEYKKSAKVDDLMALLPKKSFNKLKRAAPNKQWFYEKIAERLMVEDGKENLNAMDRGLALENEAMELFEKQTKKTVDMRRILWVRDEDDNIACSPDGIIGKKEAVEVKCLASARHIEALLTGKIPDEYYGQSRQYFVVNDKLKTLYFIFYDPHLVAKEFFWHEIKRKDIEQEVKQILDYQRRKLKEVEEIVASLTDF